MAPHRRRKISISIVIPFTIVALVFGALIWKKMQASHELHPVPQVNQPAELRKGVLFFVSGGTGLAREARELASCSATQECVNDLLEELFSGPVGDYDAALPETAGLVGVHVEGALAVVDVTRGFVTDLPAGSSAEMLAVYSVVNTVCFNYPQITAVRITVEGAPAHMKHLDLSDPLPPDYSLERDAAATNITTPSPAVPAQTVKKGTK